MYFTKTPYLIRKLLPSILWRTDKKQTIHLTFDDGPTPSVTRYILDTLKKYDAKATFFCVGEQAEKHPDIMHRIRSEGHQVGQHTYSHVDGWKADTDTYLQNIDRAEEVIQSPLFRPPYGRLTPQQYRRIKERFKIVMWDVMPGDFDQDISPDVCFHHIMNNIVDGSIVVLHDNQKSFDTIQVLLPRLLDTLQNNKWRFLPL